LNFEGASKRTRPRLDPGSLVYCRVVRGLDDGVKVVGGASATATMVSGRVDPEVSCKVGGGSSTTTAKTYRSNDNISNDDGGAARKDWTTSECTYGPLSASGTATSTSTSFRVSLGWARALLLPTNETLSALDKSQVPFEICIGVNGLIWIDAPSPEIVIMVQNAIRNGEVVGRGMVGGMVKAMVKNLRAQLGE
jgi:exosome complex component RRP40